VSLIIKVNQQIEISIYNEEGNIYKSLVQGVGDRTFSIQTPTKMGRTLFLRRGDNVKVSYFDQEGRYFFDSVIVGRSREDNVPLYRLQIPDQMQRVQKRNFVRVDIITEIKYQKLVAEKNGGDIIEDGPVRRASTLDLSGGGIKFISKEKLQKHSLVSIEIKVSDWSKKEKCIKALAKVLRVAQSEIQRGEWIVGASFEQINERDRDMLISYIFRKDLKRRQLVPDRRK